MPKLYPKEFREDVINVARDGDSKTTLAQMPKDFGLHEGTIQKWLRQADLDAGSPTPRVPGPTTDEKAELAELCRRNRVVEQELEVMRRAAALNRPGFNGDIVNRLIVEEGVEAGAVGRAVSLPG